MTYAPQSYKDVRNFLITELDMHPGTAAYGDDLDPAEVGIVGSAAHVRTGTSYHLGKSDLKMSRDPYSARLARDRRGLTDGAAALDVGIFRKTLPSGRVVTHRTLGTWLVEQCHAGASDAAWIREVIWSPDGRTVLRYDRERGQRSAPRAGEADDSHLTHDHVSGYRDEEVTPKRPLFQRFLREMGDDDVSAAEVWDTTKWVGNDGKTKYSAGSWLRNANIAAAGAKAEATKARLLAEAILAKMEGLDTSAVLARVDAHAQAERDRDDDAARRDAQLAELVRQHQSGALDAAEVVRLIGERLAASGTPDVSSGAAG
ncbi:hypothetical protein [Micromonospora sp. NPDC048063]|uniref:hypothetical protein n=1 Tax=Micromonospora sp. NPDC048063 TaxID=3364256 RepID=UPI00371618B4